MTTHRVQNKTPKASLKDDVFQQLNADLGVEFTLFTFEHPDWLEANVPNGAIVVMQTEDEGFNAWTRQVAERARRTESPPRPIVLIHIRELRPAKSRIVHADAELLPSSA